MKNKKEDEKVVQFPSKNDAFDVNEQGDQDYAIGDEPIEQKEGEHRRAASATAVRSVEVQAGDNSRCDCRACRHHDNRCT